LHSVSFFKDCYFKLTNILKGIIEKLAKERTVKILLSLQIKIYIHWKSLLRFDGYLIMKYVGGINYCENLLRKDVLLAVSDSLRLFWTNQGFYQH
jgi:hypothetical protein